MRPAAQADARGVQPSLSFVPGQQPTARRKQSTFSEPFFAARCRDVSPPKFSAAADRSAPALTFVTGVRLRSVGRCGCQPLFYRARLLFLLEDTPASMIQHRRDRTSVKSSGEDYDSSISLHNPLLLYRTHRTHTHDHIDCSIRIRFIDLVLLRSHRNTKANKKYW